MHAIYRVVEGDGLPRVLVQAGDEGGPLVERMSRNRTVALHGPLRGAYLGVEKWVRSAREGRKVVDVTDEEFLESGGGAQDHLLAASMDITIRDTKGRWPAIEQKDVTPYSRPIFFGKDAHGRPYYEFRLIRTGQALDWFSVLSAIDSQGNVLKSHTVQVNSPLRYQGYRFYQATAGQDRDGFGISGISVTKQPGVIYMYWGYAILTSGVCYIFFLKPILVGRQRRRRRKEAAA